MVHRDVRTFDHKGEALIDVYDHLVGRLGLRAGSAVSRMRTTITRRAALALAAAVASCASQPYAPQSQRIEQAVSVEESLTIFSLFAFLNAAGYDQENTQSMHGVRMQVRASLLHNLSPNLREAAQAFYAAAPLSPWHYSVAALATNGAPAFEPSALWRDDLSANEEFASLNGLAPLLRRFHTEAGVPALYETVRPSYIAYIADYRAAIIREVGAAFSYLRVGSADSLTFGNGDIGRARVIPNLLGSHQHAFSFVLDTFVSIEGPQRQIGYNPHELIHAVTNPVSYDPRYAAQQARAEALYAQARNLLQDDPPATLAAFFDECLVRAISLRYIAQDSPDRLPALEASMKDEFQRGWLLERHFWNQLLDFERQRGDLATFYPQMLSALNVDAELAAFHAG